MNRRGFLKCFLGGAAFTGLVGGLPFAMRESQPKPKPSNYTKRQRQMRLMAGLGDPKKVRIYYKLSNGKTYEGTPVANVEQDERKMVLHFAGFVPDKEMTVNSALLLDDEGYLLSDDLLKQPISMCAKIDTLMFTYRITS